MRNNNIMSNFLHKALAMPIQLCLLFSALAFVSLSMIFNEPQQSSLFPYVSPNITTTTFPVDLHTTTSSNVVLVKCPNMFYKHTTRDDSFEENYDNYKLSSGYDGWLLVDWQVLDINLSEPAQIECGKIKFRHSKRAFKLYEWSFNVILNHTANVKDITYKEYIVDDIPIFHGSCDGFFEENLVILTKKKNGRFVEVKDVHRLDEAYVNQIFYYFEKPKKTEKIKVPCGILKTFSTPPKITLPEFEPEEIEGGDISFVQVEDKTMNVAVKLRNRGDISYYRGEEISLTRMRYLENGLTPIDNSTILITSNFTINGFEIVKLTYYSPFYGEDLEVTKIFYFGPRIESFKSEETVVYSKNENTDIHNCTAYWKNIGYLKEIVYKKSAIISKHFQSTNNRTKKISKHENKLIFLKDIDKHSRTLKCIYQTPTGMITKLTKFVSTTRSIMGLNEKGYPIYSYEDRQSNVISKNALSKLKSDLEDVINKSYKNLRLKFESDEQF